MTSNASGGGGTEQQPGQGASPLPPSPQSPSPSPGGASVTRQDLPISPRPAAPEPQNVEPPQPAGQGTPAAGGTPAGQDAQAPPGPQGGQGAQGGGVTRVERPEQAEPSPPSSPSPPSPPSPQPAPGVSSGEYWHRYHLPVGVFLIAFGVTGLLGTLIGWRSRHHEIADYLDATVGLGAGAATPLLIWIKLVELLLTLTVLAGVLRRRDVWFLPALIGWIAGFSFFCVLDVWAGKTGRLAEHGIYVLAFGLLLFFSYALGVKVRVGRVPVRAAGGKASAPTNLSRTQEIALAALNRWQRGAS